MTTTRRRDQLYITVPSLFRCPISLDVMKSPVSLCTGVTYDRSSIQRWLESGHETCPATMQILPSKDFIPNLTLHRLINLWIQSSSASRTPTSPCHAADLIRSIESPSRSSSLDATLSKAFEFVNRGDASRKYLAGFNGFLEAVSGVLRRKNEKIEALELAVSVLVSVLVENGVRERLNGLILRSSLYIDSLSSLDSVIENGTLKSKIETIQLLESIAIDAESRRRIAQSKNLGPTILNLVKEEDHNRLLTEAVISLLVKISVSGSVISQIVENGVVGILSSAINDDDASKNVHEDAMKVLGMVSRSSEGRVAMSEDERCAAGIAERLLKSSSAATEEGVAALWRLCVAGGDERVKEAVVKRGGLTKMMVVLQREEGSVRRMCRDLVKALSLTAASKGQGRPRLESYHTKTMHIMPC